ncbi:hypothetical protein FP744_10006461 [Trichoderma asperellum]
MDHAEQSSSGNRTRREVVRGQTLDLYASAAAFALPKRDEAQELSMIRPGLPDVDPGWLSQFTTAVGPDVDAGTARSWAGLKLEYVAGQSHANLRLATRASTKTL